MPAILKCWSEHFSAICNEEFPHTPIQSAVPVSGPVLPISTVEVRKMKNGTVTGPDDVPAEAWKLLGRHGSAHLAILLNHIIEEGEVSMAWSTCDTMSIWKGKGDVAECLNYRPIRLLCHAMKIFEQILDASLRPFVTITPNQCGFIRSCGTTDVIHAAWLLLEKYREKNRSLHMAFVDLETAFNRVPHKFIWHALRSLGVPKEYVQWVKMLYRNVTGVVRCPARHLPTIHH